MNSPVTTLSTVAKTQSVDPAEVDRYRALADLWWDGTGPFWPLHTLNRLRVSYIRERLAGRLGRDASSEHPLEGLRVVDIGCGGGILSEALCRLGASVTGIDVVERNIEVARYHAAANGLEIDYRHDTAEGLSERGERFDVVFNMEVVEHVADLPGFLRACGALVDTGGHMFVATINRTLISWLFAIVGAEYVLRWLPRGTHQWRRFPKPAELERITALDGLSTLERVGVRVNPFTRRFSRSHFLGVNYMLLFAREGDSASAAAHSPYD